MFVYGGREAVSKPNLLLMIRLFGIPVHHVKDQAEIIDLLQREREETDVLPAAGQKPDLLIMTICLQSAFRFRTGRRSRFSTII